MAGLRDGTFMTAAPVSGGARAHRPVSGVEADRIRGSGISRAVGAMATVGLALALALPLAGCSALGSGRITAGASPYTVGSGVKTTQQRTIGTYHAVAASAGVTVFVNAGEPGFASVTADDNLVDQIVTEVRAGTLYVGIEGGVRTNNDLRVDVANSGIDSISASTGSTVDAPSLAIPALEVVASTGAAIRGGGRADSMNVTANSGANADLRNIETQSARVAVSTGATAHVYPTESVAGECTGGATLLIRGHPAHNDVSTDISATTKDGQ